MRRWERLNARQLELLQMIAAGQGDLKAVWAEVALSAQALQNRGLVKITRSAGARRAELTDAGRFYLEHGHHPDRPFVDRGSSPSAAAAAKRVGRSDDERDPSRAGVDQALSPAMDRAVTDLFDRLAAGGGTVRISEPDRPSRARWRRVIHAAKAGGRVPEGYHLRHRGRDRGDLVVELVEGDHPEARYWRRDEEASRVVVPLDHVDEIDPLAHTFVASRQEQMSAASAARAERLVNALVGTAKQRGHLVRLDGEPVPVLTIDVDGCTFGLTMFEEHAAVERVQLPSEADERKLYDWQRVKPETLSEPTGRLVIEFAVYDWAYQGRRKRWGDTKRWRLDDKLGEILAEVEARAALLKQRRREEEEEAARRQQQWAEAMQLARSHYDDAVRGEALKAQIAAWEESCRVRQFCDYLDELADNQSDARRESEIRSWVAWGRVYADRQDPGTWPRLLPEVNEPGLEDLRPYLGRWSPYGPEERGYRRSW